MKRKFEAGVTNLTNVLKHHLSSILIPMVYSYRAYGHFCLGKHKVLIYEVFFSQSFPIESSPRLSRSPKTLQTGQILHLQQIFM